jgi:pimeloyl-ACP methyl ester carboxylesterase
MALIWRTFFARPEHSSALPQHVGVQASIETNRSMAEKFVRGTLAEGLRGARLPALFVHGELDPLPVRSTLRAAALIDGAQVETVPESGHFPWLEQPDDFRAAVEKLLAESGARKRSGRRP